MKNQSKKQKQGNTNSRSGTNDAQVQRKRGMSIGSVEKRIADAERAAYERAIKESRELFDLSLKIDDKVKAGVHEIHVRIGWYVGILSFALVVAGWFGFPIISEWYAKRIEEQVTEKYVSAEVQKHLNDFTDGKVSAMIVTSVSNTEERVKSGFREYMDNQVESLGHQAQELNERIKEAESAISVYEKCVSARAGSRKDYEILVTLAGGTNRISHIASSTVEEIKKSYEQQKNTFGIGRMVLVNKDDKNKKISEDVMIFIVHNDFIGQCDGAINSLADKQDKKYVATLIHAIKHSNHLDFVYAAIRGVEKLTGQIFPALGVSESLNWWNENKTNELYYSAFENYIESQALPNESVDDFVWRKVEYLDKWIREMPNQYFAASQIPQNILFANVDVAKVQKRKEMLDFVFEYWGKENPKSVNWYVAKTAYLGQYDMKQMISFVNDRLREHPQFEEELKHGQIKFNSTFFEMPEINWPSRQKNDNGQIMKDSEEE